MRKAMKLSENTYTNELKRTKNWTMLTINKYGYLYDIS